MFEKFQTTTGEFQSSAEILMMIFLNFLKLQIKKKNQGIRWFTDLSWVHRAQQRLEVKLSCIPGQIASDFVVKQSDYTHLSLSLHQNQTVLIRKEGHAAC